MQNPGACTIRYPDLDRPHPLRPQAAGRAPHLAAVAGAAAPGAVLRSGASGVGFGFHDSVSAGYMSMVTGVDRDGAASAENQLQGPR